MLNIVLVEPEIPQNTGNIARTCAVTGAKLHIVRPMGFTITDAKLKRAGLDYWHLLDITYYDDLHDFLAKNQNTELWLLTTKAKKLYTDVKFTDNCFLLFGKETAGLPEWIRTQYPEQCLKIPMISNEAARSLNLSNSVAIVVYEAIRQLGL